MRPAPCRLRAPGGGWYAASLVVYDGLLYMTNDVGVLTCADMKTGDRVWQTRLDGVFFASPVAADGKIYFLSQTGETVVVKAGRTPQILAETLLESASSRHPPSRADGFSCAAMGACSPSARATLDSPLITRGTMMNVMRPLVASLALAIAVAAPMAQTSPTPPTASDADIRKILADRIDVHRQAVGIVVGVVDANGRRIVAYGKRAANDPRLPDGDTVYEIGSITKVFTSLLLADAVGRREVALTDPVEKSVPAKVKVPERGARSRSWIWRATRPAFRVCPRTLRRRTEPIPYADYTVEQIYQFVSAYQLARDVGAHYEYSNYGAALLGHVLARRAGMDYEALVGADPGAAGDARYRDHVDAGDEDASRRRPHGDARADGELGSADVRRCRRPPLDTNDMLTFLSAAIGSRRRRSTAAMGRCWRPVGRPVKDR